MVPLAKAPAHLEAEPHSSLSLAGPLSTVPQEAEAPCSPSGAGSRAPVGLGAQHWPRPSLGVGRRVREMGRARRMEKRKAGTEDG